MENRQLVTDELVDFEKEPIQFKTSRKLPVIVVELIEYTPN